MGQSKKANPILKLKMKFLVLLAAISCASAASSNAVTCDECQAGAAALVEHLLSDASIAEQGAILKAVVCPQLDDATGCEALLTCGLETWPAASTTTLSLKVMSAPDLVSARRLPSSPPVIGPVKNALTFLPELLPSCPKKRPSPWVLNIFKEIASVAQMGTLLTVETLFLPLYLSPCQSLHRLW